MPRDKYAKQSLGAAHRLVKEVRRSSDNVHGE